MTTAVTFDDVAEVASATIRNEGRDPTSSIVEVNALMKQLKKKKCFKTVGGGTSMRRPLILTEAQGAGSYFGSDPIPMNSTAVMSSIVMPWRQQFCQFTVNGRELMINRSDEELFDFADTKMAVAKQTAVNRLNIQINGDGSLANSIDGTQAFVTSNGLGSYGGIDASLYPKWGSQYRELPGTVTVGGGALGPAGPSTGTWTGDDLENTMDLLYKDCTDGIDSPDLAIATTDLYTVLEKQIRSRMKYEMHGDGYMDKNEAQLGFQAIMYKGRVPIVWDTNVAFGAQGETMYMFTCSHLEFNRMEGRDWNWEKPMKIPNADVMLWRAFWMGNLVCLKRRTQGRIGDLV